jgi:hypothetical protein
VSGAAPPPPPEGYYPQDAYYAPGWSAPDDRSAPPRRRRGRTVVLLVLAGVLAVAALAAGAVALRTWTDTRPLGAVTEPTSATPHQLRTGHCVEDLPDDGRVTRVRVVPCSEPHEAEVLGVHRVRGEEWRGIEAVVEESVGACEMDRRQEAAGFRPVVWTPTERSWEQGDRDALCLAWVEGGLVTGSWRDGDVEVELP